MGATGVGEGVAVVGAGVGEGVAVAVARGDGDGAVAGVVVGGGEAVAVEVAVEVAGGAGVVAGLGDGWSDPPPQAATIAATRATTPRSCPWKARVTLHNVAAGEANYPTRRATCPATCRMRSASATEVPPNFCTTRMEKGCASEPSGARGLRCRRQSEQDSTTVLAEATI